MQDKRTDVLYGSLGLIILKTLEASCSEKTLT